MANMFTSASFPADPSHLGLAGFHGVDVSSKGYILNLGISRDKSVRSNHVSKGDQRSLQVTFLNTVSPSPARALL